MVVVVKNSRKASCPQIKMQIQYSDAADPAAIFRRMPEPGTYPSAPSKPSLVSAGEDWIELEWQAPNRQGASPISSYRLQFYSPELGQTWQDVPTKVAGGATRHIVNGLRSGSSFIFLVRALNKDGPRGAIGHVPGHSNQGNCPSSVNWLG